MSVIDTATDTIVANVPAGTSPLNIALNATGTRAYVTNNDEFGISFGSDAVTVINTANTASTAGSGGNGGAGGNAGTVGNGGNGGAGGAGALGPAPEAEPTALQAFLAPTALEGSAVTAQTADQAETAQTLEQVATAVTAEMAAAPSTFIIAHELCGAADLPKVGIAVPPYATAMWKIRDELLGIGNSYDQPVHFSRAANGVHCPDKQLPTA